MDQNFLTIALVLVFVVMIFFMFRNSRKRRREQEEMQQKLVPGAEVMTSHGIYGQVISIDEEKNEAIIETTPGTRLRLHRQTLSRVIEPVAETVDPEDEAANVELDADERATSDRLDAAAGEPEFGERTEGADVVAGEPAAAEKPRRAPRKRPASE